MSNKKIRELFDPSRDIYRAIEKVITYGASQEDRLRSEISEYIVTESIEDQFESLLTRMQLAMDSGGQNEVGVWVSGFYGSGKSSFTKYLGLSLDDSARIDGTPFLQHLQNRLQKPQTRALLGSISSKYPAAVVLLDLASSMIAGATMEEVSTVLYYRVLQWAGYSKNVKVAAFERKLKKDKRYDEFSTLVQDRIGTSWKDVQNDPLITDSLIPECAHTMYPELFRTATSFNTEASDIVTFEDQRVAEMIQMAREATGKQYIVFVIDEVGQYVGSRSNLILNLQGLAENMKRIGNGQVWLIATAQQTLTEDDPRAALNAPELYKLKDRFPIPVDLQSKDIKEICYRRLLGKSPEGARYLGDLFDRNGQALRHHTKLEDAKYYDTELSKETFVNLYPFLPAHFDILLHLLGVLAKSTGGIGLRSAIKVIQDVLIEGPDGHMPVADRPVGWLATAVTLYDALEKDIRRSATSIHNAMGKVLLRFPNSAIHQDVAKTVAILQILGNMPVTRHNVACLLQAQIDAPSKADQVDKAANELINDSIVPFGEKDGNLCFFSEKLNDIDQERNQIPLRAIETRRILNESLREAFTPMPKVMLHGSLAVTTGLKAQSGSQLASLSGDRESIQTIVELVGASEYEAARARMVDESRQKSALSTIYLLGRYSKDVEEKIAEIYRCREIQQRHRNDPDQEVREYCAAQSDRSVKLISEIQHQFKQQLLKGSFVFRGQTSAVDSLGADAVEACRKYLGTVVEQVFDRYNEAPERVETSLAEQFLKIGNLKAITTSNDPLHLVQSSGGTFCINAGHKALVSIRDFIDRHGTVEGKKLIEHFGDAPFGWSQDTLRYLVAAMLVCGEIKLKVSGREVTTNGQVAQEALRTNNSFKPVGVALRDERPSNEMLARAAQRLTEISGETVIPLEQEISKIAAKCFPKLQQQYGPLAEKLDALHLPGTERVRSLTSDLTDILLADASDAPQRLGGVESSLYEDLKWASQAHNALKQGLEATVRDLQDHIKEIDSLPDTGIPGTLRHELEEELGKAREQLASNTFASSSADLSTSLTFVKSKVRDAAIQLEKKQKESVKNAQEDLSNVPDWSELTQGEQSDALGRLEELIRPSSNDLRGLKQLLNQEFAISDRATTLKKNIENVARARRLQRLEEEKAKAKKEGKTKLERSICIPRTITTAEQLVIVLGQLHALRDELDLYGDIEVTIKIED